jgi:predicted dinucleotide-binding enzyme
VNIGIIGAGDMGGALVATLARNHHVFVAGSHAESVSVKNVVRNSGGRAHAADVAACAAAELTFLVVPWTALDLVTNRLRQIPPRRLVSVVVPWNGDDAEPAVGRDDSVAERIARALPKTDVVNAFTSISAATVRNIQRYPLKPTVFVAGDDGDTKRLVRELSTEIGFDSADAGPLYAARFTEAVAFLWSALALAGNSGEHVAFRVVEPG